MPTALWLVYVGSILIICSNNQLAKEWCLKRKNISIIVYYMHSTNTILQKCIICLIDRDNSSFMIGVGNTNLLFHLPFMYFKRSRRLINNCKILRPWRSSKLSAYDVNQLNLVLGQFQDNRFRWQRRFQIQNIYYIGRLSSCTACCRFDTVFIVSIKDKMNIRFMQ